MKKSQFPLNPERLKTLLCSFSVYNSLTWDKLGIETSSLIVNWESVSFRKRAMVSGQWNIHRISLQTWYSLRVPVLLIPLDVMWSLITKSGTFSRRRPKNIVCSTKHFIENNYHCSQKCASENLLCTGYLLASIVAHQSLWTLLFSQFLDLMPSAIDWESWSIELWLRFGGLALTSSLREDLGASLAPSIVSISSSSDQF